MPYLTPNAAAYPTVCRRFRIPGDWLYLFMGALNELTHTYRWELDGDQTPQEMAEAFHEILDDYSETCLIGTIASYITPDPPSGVLPLTGGTYNDVDYPLLAAAWADTDFNNGDGTFSVPSTVGMVLCHLDPDGAPYLPTFETQVVGEVAHTNTVAEMPEHGHYYVHPIVEPSIVLGELPGFQFGENEGDVTDVAGETQPHNNVQPSFGVHFGVVAR